MRWIFPIIVAIPCGAIIVNYIFYSISSINDAIFEIGFYPVNPPTTLRNPGSIYRISTDGQAYDLICGINISGDRYKGAVKKSETERRVSSDLTKFKLKANAKSFEKISGELQTELLRRISYSLDNVQVYEISLADLAKISKELQESDVECRNAINQYLRAGDYVCQVQQVLLATAKYKISMDDHGDGNIDVRDARNIIATTIDPTVMYSHGAEISGLGLHYGMRPTPRCMSFHDAAAPLSPTSWLNRFRNRPFGLGMF